MIWYLEDPQRFRQEREALERLVANQPWLTSGEWRVDGSLRLIWDADIATSARVYPISVEYPNHFPHSPPLVLPRGPSERWSSHQYGEGGELCTEFGSDNWHPGLMGADIVQSAYRLLDGETPRAGQEAIVTSRHAVTVGQALRGSRWRLLITRELRDIISTQPERALLTGKLIGMYHEESYVLAVTSLVLSDGTQWIDPGVPKPIKQEGYEREMLLTRWPEGDAVPTTQSAKALRGAVNGTTADNVPYLITCGTKIYAHRLWDEGDDTISEISSIPAQPAKVRLDNQHACLGGRKIALVGCGSLGSKLAVMLSRAGAGKFLLVDDDVMLPDNLVRHDLDWRDIGSHKADAIARRVQLVNPMAECEVRRHRLGGQESSGSIETLIATLATCDLIIDATADVRVFGYVAAAAASGAKPLVWAEVFGGGFGGLIARHRPSLEPDPTSMRRAIEDWCREQGQPIERASDYETRGSGPSLIADDADVTVIAAHAARLAVDTLIARSPSMFPYSVYMVGLASGWIFEQPFDTRPIDVGKPAAQAAAPVDQTLVAEEMARVRELFQKHANATRAATSDRSTPQA